jgi:hypothetical protein
MAIATAVARADERLPVRLQDYPFATVRLACDRCERQERYHKGRLLEEHGPDLTMQDLRPLIAVCDHRLRSGQTCGFFYPDLSAGQDD